MNTRELTEKLHSDFPYPYSRSELNEIMDFTFPELIQLQKVPKSQTTQRQNEELEKLRQVIINFEKLLFSYDCCIGRSKPNQNWVFYLDTKENSRYSNTDATLYLNYFHQSDAKQYRLIEDYISDYCNQCYGNFLFPKDQLLTSFDKLYTAYTQMEHKFRGLKKGDDGEEYVEQQLSLFKNKFKYAYNIKFKHEDFKGKTSETDLYVITSKGIICCEIKNKGTSKDLFKISRDGQWAKYDVNDKFVEPIDSPFAQNTRHCIATEEFLTAHGVDDFKIIPLVIIGNEHVRIHNESRKEIIRASELYDFVSALDLPEVYDEAYQNKILDLFNNNCDKIENNFDIYTLSTDAATQYLEHASKAMRIMFDSLEYRKKVIDYFSEYYGERKKIKTRQGRIRKTLLILLALTPVAFYLYNNLDVLVVVLIIAFLILRN